MIWLGIIIGMAGIAVAMIVGHGIGYRAAKAEDEHYDLSIENGYLKLLGSRMGQIRAAHKGIARLRKKIKRLQSVPTVSVPHGQD